MWRSCRACCASTLRNPARGSRLLVRVRDRPFGFLVIFLAAPPVVKKLTRVCGWVRFEPQVSTGLQISRPRAFRGLFGLGKALQKATSRHSTTHRALFTAMSAFTVASNLTSRVALPKARAARRTARRATAVRASEEPAAEPAPEVPAAPAVPTSFTLAQAFAFSGPEGSNFAGSGPEIMNGRLAMLGFVAAAGAEIATGEPVYQQFGEAPAPILLTIALFTAASVVPFLSNTKAEDAGMWTREKELLNGRAAMIGMLALLGFEAVKHVPCL